MPSKMIPEIMPPSTEMRIKPCIGIHEISNASAIIFANAPRITERISVSDKEA